MSIWTRISEALSALAKGESLSRVYDRLRAREREVAFAIAVISLGAKMAKADGRVTRDEVVAFREVFAISPDDETQVARVFDLARRDVAGFEEYAKRIARMFAEEPTVLGDIMEGLFHIAAADGTYHERENAFLERVAEIFRLPEAELEAMRARFAPCDPDSGPDPHSVLGVRRDAPHEEVRRRWRELVREHHPDAMLARGVPEEAIRLAERRMIDINRAWEEILRAGRQGSGSG